MWDETRYFDRSLWAMRLSSGSRASNGVNASRRQNDLMATILELQAKRELQQPGVAHRTADQPSLIVADRGVGLSELRMVEQVEGLGAEGELNTLLKLEILDEREIEVDAARPE